MNYVHEYEAIVMEGQIGAAFYRCRHCERECSDANDCTLRADPCPERIVQESVARIRAELQRVNVLPAKRRDRPR